MKPADIRRLLKERGIMLTKSLGQNFLHDPQQLERIVAAAELTRGDKVLEIGAGLGPLTEHLLQPAVQVLAIEKDRRLVEVLRERFQQPVDAGESFELLHDDALDWLQREPRDLADWKLVSNLPYSVASPILVEVCRGPQSPGLVVVTLQLEVAQRLMAGPGGKDYGVLTLLVQLDFEPVRHFKISRSCFFPEPDVDSACIVLRRRPEPLLPGALRPLFVRVVKRAFSQRRKMMKNLLRAEWPAERVELAMRKAAIDPMARAEAVSLEHFIHLVNELYPSASQAKPSGEEWFDVVNERDEVVGRAPRAEVHARGLLHRAVHVLVFNERGDVFLQKRSMTKDKSPGLWDSSASGHVDSGEDYDQSALREMREEIGLTPAAPLQRLFKLAACAETDQEHVWVYRCEAEGPFDLNPNEIERGEWVAPEELDRRLRERPQDYASAFRHLWSHLAPRSGPQARHAPSSHRDTGGKGH